MLLHKKLIVTVSLLSAVVFVATTAMKSSTADDPIFKNLKVLPKDISKEDLDKVMDQWRDALGVRCNFCHVRNAETNKMDMAADDKPEKLMAREMMKMTEQINKKYFKEDKDKEKENSEKKDMIAAVACMTCHHGAAHPNSIGAVNKPAGFGPGGGGFNQGGTPPPGQGGQQQPPPVKQ